MRSGIAIALTGAALLLPARAVSQELPPPPTPEQVRVSQSHAGSSHPMSVVRQILVRQEQFRNRNGRYARDFEELRYAPPEGAEGTLTTISETSFSAVARSGELECAAYVGDVGAPRPYVDQPSAVRCSGPDQPSSAHRH